MRSASVRHTHGRACIRPASGRLTADLEIIGATIWVELPHFPLSHGHPPFLVWEHFLRQKRKGGYEDSRYRCKRDSLRL
jgi:hypothetical protein